jgi:D-3-phosphoglycerate dehydrogenase / 2-oxoglutarate reductase
MRIVVLDDYPDALRRLVGLQRLDGHDVTIHTDAAPDEAALVARLARADAALMIQQRVSLSGAVLAQLPSLRLISQTGRNLSHLDLAACDAAGITVSARGMGGSTSTAELTWGLILGALRDIPRQAQRLRDGFWLDGIGTSLAGRTLGIWGLGTIGSQVAVVGRAFGMRVLCWGRETTLARAQAAGFEVARDAEDLFSEADVLSLHLAMKPETRGLVTPALLARMKPSALLVNTARAGLIAPGALRDALAAGRPGRAAIDVYDHEPVLGAADPLIGLPNTLCTPHLGYSVEEMYGPVLNQAIDQILAFAAGAPINVVNHPRL